MALTGAAGNKLGYSGVGGGGAGAGTIYGGTKGTDYLAATTPAPASAICYGAGAGGSGMGQNNTGKSVGGSGATGVVMLMWVGP